MSYILTSNNCKGRHIVFAVENGEYLQEGVGNEFSGVLALQTFNDRNYRRLTFADAKNVYTGAAKKLFGMVSGIMGTNNALEHGKNVSAFRGYAKAYKAANQDYLCHFDFSENDLRSGKKEIKYYVQLLGLTFISGITCYDFTDGTGCSYLFSDDDDARAFAKAIGIKKVEYLDYDGKVTSIGEFEGSEKSTGGRSTAKGGPSIDPDSCVYCGACVDICPVGAIIAGDAHYTIDSSMCIECDSCMDCCPTGAIG